MKGILIDPNKNEFLAVIKDVEKFIKTVMDIEKRDKDTWKESYEMIKDLDIEDKIDDIDIYNQCSVCVSPPQYEDDGFDICIYGDDGMLHFKLQTKPNTI